MPRIEARQAQSGDDPLERLFSKCLEEAGPRGRGCVEVRPWRCKVHGEFMIVFGRSTTSIFFSKYIYLKYSLGGYQTLGNAAEAKLRPLGCVSHCTPNTCMLKKKRIRVVMLHLLHVWIDS